MKHNSLSLSLLVVVLVGVFSARSAMATDLVYSPINPSFGGNPNNAPGLASIAGAQNAYRPPKISALERFNSSLQQSILNRLTTQTLTTIFGGNSTLVPGSYDTSAYTITITDQGNGSLLIATTDKTNGAVVSFEVSNTALDIGP